MIIHLDEQGCLQIEDARNFRAFSFRDSGGRAPANGAVTVAGDHAWISETALREWQQVAEDSAWQANLTGMIEYARAKGWVDSHSGRIRAHIELG